MANRFTKSVLERQAMEAKRRGKSGAQEEAATAPAVEGAAPDVAPSTAASTQPAAPSKASNAAADAASTADTATQQAAQEALTRLAAVQGSAGQEAAERSSLREEGEPVVDSAPALEATQSGAVQADIFYGTNVPAAFRAVANSAPQDKAEELYVAMAAQAVEHPAATRKTTITAQNAEPAKHRATVTGLPQATQNAQPEAEAAALAESVMQNNLSDLVASYLIRTPERMAKNKTFYLDEVVINGIRAAAKKQKVTESKLVNDILRGVLGIH